MFYLIIFIIILFFACFDVNKKFDKNSETFVYFLMFSIFWLVAGLRYETGVDWLHYTKFFNKVEPIDAVITGSSEEFSYFAFEYGFKVLNSILKFFTKNVQVLFLFVALITNLLLFSSYRKYSNHVFISLLIYFGSIYFILDMSGIRQCIALNIFLWSLKFIIKRQFFRYTATILLASLFHGSALILIPLYIIFKSEFSTKTIIFFAFAGFCIMIFELKWLKFIIYSSLELFSSGMFYNKLLFYSTYELYSSGKSFGLGVIFNLLILVFILINRKGLKKNVMFNTFLNLYLMSVFFYYYTWELSEFSNRFRLYFLVGNSVLLTYFIGLYKEKLKKYLVFSFIVSFSLFYSRIYLFHLPLAVSHSPYQNYIFYKALDIPSTGHERLLKYQYIFISNTLQENQ